VVTKVAWKIAFSPRNPARLLYTVACSHDESESGTFYLDAAAVAPVQASPVGMDDPGDWFNQFWSPDDKFVVIPSIGHAILLNLQTGQRSGFLSDLFSAKGFSSCQFRAWSPDGNRLAVVASSDYMRDDRSMFFESDLLSIDPTTLKDSYVATIRKYGSWNAGEFTWIARDGTYDLAVDPSLQNDPAIYRKTR
jgi:WD40 repeat protein